MTENQTCLFTLPECAAEENTPVFISGGSLFKDAASESIKAQLKLKNLSGKEISSVSYRVFPQDKDGRVLDFDSEYEYSGPFGEDDTHEISDIMLPFMTSSFKAEAVQAVFTDGSRWTAPSAVSETSPLPEKDADAEPAGSKPEDEASDLSSEVPVIASATSETDGGSQDNNGSSAPDEDPSASDSGSSETPSDDKKPAPSVRKEHSFSFRKLAVFLIPAVLILSGLAIIFIGAYLPERRYTKAVELYNSGMLNEAISAFDSMNGYKDSDKYINSAETALKYQAAVELFNEGDYDGAYKAFSELGAYANSAEWAEESRLGIFTIAYGEADSLLRKGRLQDAADAFYRIRDYSDSWERCFDVWGRITDRKTISAGSHTVCLTDKGRILTAGGNDDGELDLSAWEDIRDISAGNGFTVGLRADGTVVAAGNNDYGQCNVEEWTEIVSVYAGYWSTVGIKADGTVMLAGRDCDVTWWENIMDIDSSIFHTVGLMTDGTVVAAETKDISGSTHNYGQFDVSDWKDIVDVAAGVSFTVGLRKDGTVVAAGDNTYGQCDAAEWEDIVAISANGWHVVGLKSDGTVVAAGWNENGECDVEEWEDIIAVSTGTSHTLGLKSDGTVVAAGNNKDGRCDVEGWDNIRTR